MKECISIKTDYSLLQSIIQIDALLSFGVKNKFNTLGIIDDNLSGSREFLGACHKNSIKPVIGYEVNYNDKKIILYAKNYFGLKKLFKLNTFLLDNDLNIIELTKYINDLIILLPYSSINLYSEFSNITNDIFIGYKNETERKSSLILTTKIIPFNVALALNKSDTNLLKIVEAISKNTTVTEIKTNYSDSFITDEDLSIFTNLINIELPKHKLLIPHYDNTIKDSYAYLESLAIKGLYKRLGTEIPDKYKKRLLYELHTIKKMNYVDYFLIVYDYVKYAIKSGILVGPGRGSAAGSLVTYSLGITGIDPLKYGLLFERFLNPERISMPDIDIDFDAERRDDVVSYVKEKYGKLNTLTIMTYGTLASKQVLISLSNAINIDISALLKLIDSKKTLKQNLTKDVVKILNTNYEIKKLYYLGFKLEGLKKHVSTHAAGVVVSSVKLDEVIPIIKSGTEYLTGYTMNFLEELGLLKMDFLAIKDLTIISDILKIIPEELNLNKIDLNDNKVLEKFKIASTVGIFQFESEGMKNFLGKLKPTKFLDLVVALALFRPGPMQNINSFIKRKEGKEKINTIVPELEAVLKETYGIIVYQEQIMQIFNIIGAYSVAEADIIRRAISKKDEKIIYAEKDIFIKKAIKNNYKKEIAEEIYNLIITFANYGFNKSHSVAYALVGYQMMHLKVYYPEYFYIALLNTNLGSSSKTKEYIDEAKCINIEFLKPDINLSGNSYKKNKGIIMPLNLIKNIGTAAANDIISEREKELYKDFFDFIARTYGKNVNIKTLETLIYAGAFDSFNETRKTLIENINNGIIYAELMSGLDSSLVAKPSLIKHEEYEASILMNKELELFGFYVSNHPASKYKEIKINTVSNYFDKVITTVGLLENIKTIKTKRNETMAFLQISDETGKLDYTLFPNRIGYINQIQKGDLLKISGRVQKRLDKYQVVINNLTIIKDNC
ncbi:MAG: DNA polymerase III subunit alpha [Bacilli bacterium]|nr:DNA polymerase III subunit alpha [Bacilli bacterium]